MKKFIPFVLFFGFLLSALFMSCEPATNQKDEPVPTPTLSSILISQKPAKLSYDYEDALDLTGLVVKAKYSDGSEKAVDGWTSDPKPWSKLTTSGTVTVTITYEEKTASFTVTVGQKPVQKTLSSIYISKQADKLNYEYNALLELNGLEIKGKYSDGTEEVLEGWTSEPKAGSSLTASGKVTITYEGKTTSFTITVAPKPVITSNEYFWGTWVRMDNGKEYEVLETSVVQGSNNYKVTASDSTTLTVSSLGTFTKESDGVIVCNNIPYYRKGGANLEYSLKLVGFTTNGRAAGIAMSGIKGKGKSSKYTNFESEGESDSKGEIKLKAPTANDTQTVEISNGNDIVVIPGLKINNSGDYMGTVALVGKDDYNLKITGTISDDQKDNGYLYGNNAKTYNMQLTITNISENKCSTSGCSIESEDSNLVLSSETNLKGFTISTLAGGATKTISISLSYGEITQPYVDTGITVTIKNPLTKQEWKDYIPLRFFKGTIPITIAAKNPENNSNAALNGFIIYPDGNNQFFAIKNNSCKPVFVPTFGATKPYMLVFSGATVTSQLDDSTEMYYTVEPATLSPRTVVTDGDLDVILNYISFGGENHSETSAYNVTEGFEAYLSEGEIDYYKITADSDTYYGPGGSMFYSVSYVNEKGDVPDTFLTAEGAVLSTIQLPEMTCNGYKFLGWYIGNTKIVSDNYTVSGNITLTAKWQKNCSVSYVSAHSTAPASIIVGEGEKLTVEQLPELTSSDYFFGGWYVGETRVTAGSYTVTDDVTLTAKWSDKCTVSYVTAHGTAPQAFDVESGTALTSANLPALTESGWKFLGWYTNSSYDEATKASAGQSVTTSITLYAKWEEYTGPDDGFVFVEGGTFSMGSTSGDSDEKPVHNVTLSSFYMSDHELTQAEYVAVMGTNPSYFKSSPASGEVQENRPVENVSWFDAIYFCNKYSESVGLTPCYKVNGNTSVTSWSYTPHNGNSISGTITCNMTADGYRLPTEAEWEYAAKGGNQSNGYTYSGSNSIDSVAWYTSNSDSKTHEVKKKSANELGLFDMSGNVWEWCWDWYASSYSSESVTDPCGASSGSSRLGRGGSWSHFATYCRSAYRSSYNPYRRNYYGGFRLVRSAQ